jgi:hypothetical protein
MPKEITECVRSGNSVVNNSNLAVSVKSVVFRRCLATGLAFATKILLNSTIKSTILVCQERLLLAEHTNKGNRKGTDLFFRGKEKVYKNIGYGSCNKTF